MQETVRVALMQVKPYPEMDNPRNVGHAIRLLEQCRGKNVDIACLPECFPWAGEDTLADMARKLRCYIAAGLVENIGDKQFNTVALFDRSGLIIGRQRKVNLGTIDRRHFGFSPGESAFSVVETDFARIGLLVGIDFWGQPEGARALTDKGADLIINQSIFQLLRRHWKHGTLVRSFDNFVPVVGVNAADFNCRVDGRIYRHLGGGSMIIQPPRLVSDHDFRLWLRSLDSLDGWVTVELDEREQVHFGEVDLGTTRRFRAEFWRHFGIIRHRVE